MAGLTPQANKAGTSSELNAPYPDTQNETGRNLTAAERTALKQRVKQLVVNLNTQRFDPSTVASEAACKDLSKLLPACLAHEEDSDEALELYRNIITITMKALNGCFVRDTLSHNKQARPTWIFDTKKEAEGRAFEKLLANSLWGILAFLDQLEGQQAETAKFRLAENLFPSFDTLLTADGFDRISALIQRDALFIIEDCITGSKQAKKLFFKNGRRTLGKLLAHSHDYPSCRAAMNISTKILSAEKEDNEKNAKMLFPDGSWDEPLINKLRAAWADLPFSMSKAKAECRMILSSISSKSQHQPQFLYALSDEIRIGDVVIKLHEAENDGTYRIAFNERSITCFITVDETVYTLDFPFTELLSCEMSANNEVLLKTSSLPVISPALRLNQESSISPSVTTKLQLATADITRLQESLKSVYAPNLSISYAKRPTGPKASQSKAIHVFIPAPVAREYHNPNNTGAERAAEFASNLRGSLPSSPVDVREGPQAQEKSLPIQSHLKTAKAYTGRTGGSPKSKPQSRLPIIAGSPREQYQAPHSEPGAGEITRMSLDNSPDSSLPLVPTNAQKHPSTGEGAKESNQLSKVQEPKPSRNNANNATSTAAQEPEADQHGAAKLPVTEEDDESALSDLEPASDVVTVISKVALKAKKGRETVSAKPKKKGRDSGFDEGPQLKGGNVKEPAAPANDEDTDYDDVSVATSDQEKAKTSRRGKKAAPARDGRGRGAGKKTPVLSTVHKSRADSEDFTLPTKANSKEGDVRAARSSRRIRNVVPIAQPVEADAHYSDGGSVDVQATIKIPASRTTKRKVPNITGLRDQSGEEDDFFDRSNKRKKIDTFSQLVGSARDSAPLKKKNPASARKDRPVSVADNSDNSKLQPAITTTVTPMKREANIQRKPVNLPDVSGEIEQIRQQEIRDAFEGLYADTPAGSDPEHEQYDAPQEDPMRDYTTLLDEDQDDVVVNESIDTNSGKTTSKPRKVVTVLDTLSALKVQGDHATIAETAFESVWPETQMPRTRGNTAASTESEQLLGAAKANPMQGVQSPGMANQHKQLSPEGTSMIIDAVVETSRQEASQRMQQIELPTQGQAGKPNAIIDSGDEALCQTHRKKNADFPAPAQISAQDTEAQLLELSKAIPKERLRELLGYSSAMEDVAHPDLTKEIITSHARDTRTSRSVLAHYVDNEKETPEHGEEIPQKSPKEAADWVRTSTPVDGYEEVESQTQLMDDPLLNIREFRLPIEHELRRPASKSRNLAKPNHIKAGVDTGIPREADATDRFADLHSKLAILLVNEHRKGIRSYQAGKSAGIDSVINIVAAGCREAESLDTNFLKRLQDLNNHNHKEHAKASLPLKSLIGDISADAAKVTMELQRLREARKMTKSKLVPFFSNFKSLQNLDVKY